MLMFMLFSQHSRPAPLAPSLVPLPFKRDFLGGKGKDDHAGGGSLGSPNSLSVPKSMYQRSSINTTAYL
jgi:hypothetical protein